ncbi:uncharacterized protein JCM10292_001880 [Rhodotorula paludigena]|uniref:uncharacterized protein n=1 Tax=Rhodotorula paludigena TaxID=86838 RepID=UPI00317A7DD8
MLLGKELYRQLVREATHLPDARISEHYLARIRTTFLERNEPESSQQAARRTKHAQKLLRQLQAVNDGYIHALTRAYETAYGLRGPQKHQALEPFTNPGLKKREFPPALAALVTSSIAHTSRPPSTAQLTTPPTLPERADPTSEEARLLGPLTPERVRAIRRRWWNSQTGKIRAPLAVHVRRPGGEDVRDVGEATRLLRDAGLGSGLAEDLVRAGWSRLEQLERTATSKQVPLPPRRLQTAEQRATKHAPPEKLALPRIEDAQRRVLSPSARNSKWHNPKQLTARLLRRRAEAVLEEGPVVVVHVPAPSAAAEEQEGEKKAKVPSKKGGAGFEVKRSELAHGEKGRVREMTDEERWWHEQEAASASAGGKKRR